MQNTNCPQLKIQIKRLKDFEIEIDRLLQVTDCKQVEIGEIEQKIGDAKSEINEINEVIDPHGVKYRNTLGKIFRYAFVGKFYEGAAVVKASGTGAGTYFHIDHEGKPLYEERYDDVGNFHEGIATVQEAQKLGTGKTFHITKDGKPLYAERYYTVYDFKNGYAYANNKADNFSVETFKIDLIGKAVSLGNIHPSDVDEELKIKENIFPRDKRGYYHVDRNGQRLYSESYYEIDDFHEGLAAVCDNKDRWFHIDMSGRPIYHQKYSAVGEYIDGVSRVVNNHHVSYIDSKGRTVFK